MVRGAIPSFFIDLVTEAGATFNAESGYFSLNGDDAINKQAAIVQQMKDAVDREYADGRTTVMGDEELENMLRELDFNEYERLSHIHLHHN